jgi:hypothetical protein
MSCGYSQRAPFFDPEGTKCLLALHLLLLSLPGLLPASASLPRSSIFTDMLLGSGWLSGPLKWPVIAVPAHGVLYQRCRLRNWSKRFWNKHLGRFRPLEYLLRSENRSRGHRL